MGGVASACTSRVENLPSPKLPGDIMFPIYKKIDHIHKNGVSHILVVDTPQ
jgi:hypothetical protein